ncbi:MAG: hypothetical protein ACLGQW_00080 [Acidobacteriota bacterium]
MAAVVHRIVLRTPETVGSMAQFTTLEQCRRESAEAAAQAQNAQGFMGQASASAQASALSAAQAASSAASFPKGVAPGSLPPAWCLGSAAFQDMRFIDIQFQGGVPLLDIGLQTFLNAVAPGVNVGDFAMVSSSINVGQMQAFAQKDAVFVQITNLSGSPTMPTPNVTFYVRVMKRIP